jgi:putative endonuclease
VSRGHFVYLVRCADGSYYCGYSNDPVGRTAAHNAGKGSKILRGKLPVRLAYTRRLTTKGDALRLEIELKRRAHGEKQELSRRWKASKRSKRV